MHKMSAIILDVYHSSNISIQFYLLSKITKSKVYAELENEKNYKNINTCMFRHYVCYHINTPKILIAVGFYV